MTTCVPVARLIIIRMIHFLMHVLFEINIFTIDHISYDIIIKIFISFCDIIIRISHDVYII